MTDYADAFDTTVQAKYKGHSFKGTFDGSYSEGVYTFNYTGSYK